MKGKDDIFSHDVEGIGQNLLRAAFPPFPIRSKNYKNLIALLDSIYPPPTSTSLKQELGNLLGNMAGSKGHDEFLNIVSETMCKPSMRLTMEEVSHKLQDFPEDDLPLFQ